MAPSGGRRDRKSFKAFSSGFRSGTHYLLRSSPDALGFPPSRFLYPKGPRDATWASRCQRVDDNFSKFWKAVDKWSRLVNVCNKELWALAAHVLAPFAVTSTDWVALLTSTSKSQGVQEQSSPAALMPFGGALQSSAAKEEVKLLKTRAAAQQAEEIPTVPTIAVTSKAYKILTAFAELEFKLNKARGSAWTFHHSDERRGITDFLQLAPTVDSKLMRELMKSERSAQLLVHRIHMSHYLDAHLADYQLQPEQLHTSDNTSNMPLSFFKGKKVGKGRFQLSWKQSIGGQLRAA
ncbi:hypothetical protein C8J57DRAFT_1249515 [Mycena rebaudengoi]|nr:hypothetical protein C8J57DRAFT_1249515 [Mycena rebaudengoi]